MAARVFEDSAGTSWEVFEVHRSVQATRGVSQGLEAGWLAFSSVKGRRRLAPFPSDWESGSATSLEQLCAAARPATPSGYFKRREADAEHAAGPPSGSSVRSFVRSFARDARQRKMPAIEAMLRLRVLLAERYGGDADPEARAEVENRKRIRQLFVEAFYFDRPD